MFRYSSAYHGQQGSGAIQDRKSVKAINQVFVGLDHREGEENQWIKLTMQDWCLSGIFNCLILIPCIITWDRILINYIHRISQTVRWIRAPNGLETWTWGRGLRDQLSCVELITSKQRWLISSTWSITDMLITGEVLTRSLAARGVILVVVDAAHSPASPDASQRI